MELLYLLKDYQLAFVHDSSHKFKPDNPNVKCVFVPSNIQYNPPVMCHFALLNRSQNSKNNSTKWLPEYNLVAKCTNNNKVWLLYVHNSEKLNF